MVDTIWFRVDLIRFRTYFSVCTGNTDRTYSCPRDLRVSVLWGFIWGLPWNPSDHHSTIVLRGLRGPSIGTPLCRESPVSRTADVIFSIRKTRKNIRPERDAFKLLLAIAVNFQFSKLIFLVRQTAIFLPMKCLPKCFNLLRLKWLDFNRVVCKKLFRSLQDR